MEKYTGNSGLTEKIDYFQMPETQNYMSGFPKHKSNYI